MSYTHELIEIARRFEQPLSVEYSKERNIYKVYIDKVHLKDGYARTNIWGFGTTIEDACYQFICKARSKELMHFLTDHVEKIL